MADGGKTRADGDTYKLPPIDIHKDGSPRAAQNRSRPGSKLQPLVGEDNKSPVFASGRVSSRLREASSRTNDKLLAVVDNALGSNSKAPSVGLGKSTKTKRKTKRTKENGKISTIHKEESTQATDTHTSSVDKAKCSSSEFTPLDRFRKLAYQIKNQIMWKRGLERAEQHLKTAVPTSFDSQTDTLTFNVNAFRPEIQSYGGLSLRAKAILMQPSFNRTDEELKFIHQFTIRLKCFDRYPIYVRKELARVLYYEAFEKGRVVIRQGDIGFNFYFILSGSVFVEMQEEDQKTGKKHNMIIGELGAGAAFGELALLHDDRRRATIVCNEDCEFLKIDKPDFDEVLKKNYEREWATRMQHLKSHPLFQSWTTSSLHHAVEGSTITEYPSDTLILKDLSATSDKVYFIVKGTCNVVQKVYLMENIENKTQVHLTTKRPKEKLSVSLPPILYPGNESEDKLDELIQSNLVYQQRQSRYGPVNLGLTRRVKRWWIIHTLQPGDFFGVGEGREGMSVISNQKVEVLVVNKVVFKKHNRGKMLIEMRDKATEFYPTQEEALSSYILNRKWNAYKRKLVLEAVQKRNTPLTT